MPAAICTKTVVFFGWTQAELEELLASIKAQVLANGLDYITTASIAGKSVSNGQRMSLKDWMTHLAAALRELDATNYGTARNRVKQVQIFCEFPK